MKLYILVNIIGKYSIYVVVRSSQIFLLAHFELNETPDKIENDYDLLDI
jgi:hypothetical protein